MPRIVLPLLAGLLLLVPATAQGDSGVRVRGTVALKDSATHLVTVRAAHRAVALRVPGSLAAIRVGQRVELRGSTLRAHGRGSRVLARDVTIASSTALPTPSPRDDDEADDDEVEIKGKITSLSPLTVQSATRTVSCAAPVGSSLAGFAIGDFVEITCDRRAGAWVLRELEHEDDEDDEDDDDDDDKDHDDEDDDHSGPGDGDD